MGRRCASTGLLEAPVGLLLSIPGLNFSRTEKDMMKRLLFLILFLSIQGALAETGKIEIVGHAVDKMGNRSTVSIVELGRDRYLALSIKNDDKPEDATFAVVKREVDRLLEMIEKGARTRKNLSEGDLEILDSLGGGDSGLAVIRLHLSLYRI